MLFESGAALAQMEHETLKFTKITNMPHENEDGADSTSSTAETHSYTPEELLTTIVEDDGDIMQVHADGESRSVVLTILTGTVGEDHTVVRTVDWSNLVIPEFPDEFWRVHAVESHFGPKPVDGIGPGVVVFDRITDEDVTVEEGIERLHDLLTDTI